MFFYFRTQLVYACIVTTPNENNSDAFKDLGVRVLLHSFSVGKTRSSSQLDFYLWHPKPLSLSFPHTEKNSKDRVGFRVRFKVRRYKTILTAIDCFFEMVKELVRWAFTTGKKMIFRKCQRYITVFLFGVKRLLWARIKKLI